MRISKTVNGVTTKIFRTNGQPVGMNMSDGKDMTFILDGDGNVYGVHYDHYSASGLRSETYYFAYNAQGDVIGIYDFSGRLMATYDYDEWGNCTVNVLAADSNGHAIDSPDHIAQVNPFRYRGYFYDAETGFYYLNSRYYDPGTGRFVNADTITDGGSGLLANNLFIYVGNNPVNSSDYSGHWIIKNAIKWVTENVAKPIVKAVQNKLSRLNATYSRGINISGSPSFWSFNIQGGTSIDTKGNVAIQGSFAGGVTVGDPSCSFTAYKTITHAPNIKKLEGSSCQIGGSFGAPVFGVPLAAGGDFNIIPDTESNKTYYGLTANVGLGTSGGEVHVEWGETVTWKQTQFNVFDVAKGIYVKIMEW